MNADYLSTCEQAVNIPASNSLWVAVGTKLDNLNKIISRELSQRTSDMIQDSDQ